MSLRIRTNFVLFFAVFSFLLYTSTPANAAVVGRAISASGDLNLDAFDNDADGDTFPSNDGDGDSINEAFNAPGDMFGPGQRGLAGGGDPSIDSYPFAILDESLSIFTGDTIGVIKGGDILNGTAADTEPFFGAVDTDNPDTCAGENSCDAASPQQATWDFDVSGASGGLTLSIDFAAMGDFEDPAGGFPDIYSVETSFGGAFTPLFTNTVDEAGNLDYTLESGVVTNLDDPVSINGVQLNNEFQTISVAVPGSGDTLTVRFSADTDGGSEAFVLRNIVVEDGGAAGVAGDYNGNGIVDAADYTVWLQNLGSTTALANEDPAAGTPGIVDQEDYDYWKSRFGATSGASTGGGSIPEPGTACLFVLALLQLGALRRR